MNDQDILTHIQALVEEEHSLREGAGDGQAPDQARLKYVEESLDQCWDLLRQRRAKKELARLESQLHRVTERIERLHAEMAAHASDYGRLAALQTQLDGLSDERDELELAWLEAAEALEDAG